MDQHQEPKNFEDICQDFGIWVLKYCSATFAGPVYLLWYNETDGSGLDKLLTFRSGQFFGVSDPDEISPKTEQYYAELTPFEPLKEWRDCIIPFRAMAVSTYYMDLIGHSLVAGALDERTLDKLVSFVNLLDDYIRQDELNNQLSTFRDNENLVAVWDYYYQNVFCRDSMTR